MMSTYRPFTTTARGLSLLIAALAMLFASTAALAQTMASSVSQHGITWYFDQEYEVGQYANGDWWVLGPVNITRIDPESVDFNGRIINGTQVNPIADGGSRREIGYDSNGQMDYVEELNRAPSRTGQPLELHTGSVVSTRSRVSPTPSGNEPRLEDTAILTVVSEEPPGGAFRPHPYGTDKTSHWVESQLDYSILRSLPLVDNATNIASRSTQMLRFWNEQAAGTWTQRMIQAWNNQPSYGSSIAERIGQNALLLHLDHPKEEKRDLFVGLVQYGLDNYGRIQAGGRWWADGGHNHGRKLPVVLASLALNDSDILNAVDGTEHNNRFQEDCTTWYVSEADIGREHRGDPYTIDMVGWPEWGIRHCSYPERDNASWDNATYRYVGAQYVPNALAMMLIPNGSGVDAWNWPAFFDYADRFRATGNPGSGAWGMSAFTRNMWDAYREIANSTGQSETPPKAPTVFVD